jgi:hypothetical protein
MPALALQHGRAALQHGRHCSMGGTAFLRASTSLGQRCLVASLNWSMAAKQWQCNASVTVLHDRAADCLRPLHCRVVSQCTAGLPEGKPRYVMGVGYPLDIVICSALVRWPAIPAWLLTNPIMLQSMRHTHMYTSAWRSMHAVFSFTLT